jgi:hypothetical protein
MQTGWGGECGEHWLLTDVIGWWGRVVRDTRDEEGGYKENTGEGEAHWYAGHWPSQGDWLGTASGVRAASMVGVNSERRDFMNMHVSPWCPPCPDGHPWVVTQPWWWQ